MKNRLVTVVRPPLWRLELEINCLCYKKYFLFLACCKQYHKLRSLLQYSFTLTEKKTERNMFSMNVDTAGVCVMVA